MCEVKKLNPLMKDVVGVVYNRFTIIENLPSIKYGKNFYKRVKALCECGNTRELCYRDLKREKVKSCGCINTNNRIDLAKNNIYSHWTILSEAEPYMTSDGSKMRKVLAGCICGIQKILFLNSLRMGNTKSCGCMTEHKIGYQNVNIDSAIPELTIEQMNQRKLGNWKIVELISAKRNEKREIIRTVKAECKCGYVKESILKGVGNSKQCITCAMDEIKSKISEEERVIIKRLQRVYNSLKTRCNNSNNKDYINYGGRGIKIEESFNTFFKFREWVISQGYTYDCKLEIDRRDNNENYSVDNCRLLSKAENNRNMRRNVMSWEIVNEIRFGEYTDTSNKELAEMFKCTTSTIKDVKNYKTWITP